MKTVKTTVKAQQICLDAIEKILPYFTNVWEALEKTGLINNVEIQFKTWNSGYEVAVEYNYNPEIYRMDEKENVRKLTVLAERMKRFYLQPCTFFDEKMKEGFAQFEGRKLNIEVDYDSLRSPQFGTMEEAEEVACRFAEVCINECHVAKDVIEVLS